MKTCDFANSYLTWGFWPGDPGFGERREKDRRRPGHMPWGNSVRIQFDARCELTDEKTGNVDEFFLITPCRGEWMYRPDVLFANNDANPNREYCGVWSRTEFMGFGGDGQTGQEQTRTVNSIEERYSEFGLTLRHFEETLELKDAEQIIEATHASLPLVGRTEIWDYNRETRAMVEYPVKTINLHPERKRFQVDTGPVLFPDLSLSVERSIERFYLAFVGYNTLDMAEFILRVPTTLHVNGKVAHMAHYSDSRRMEAKNALFSAGDI